MNWNSEVHTSTFDPNQYSNQSMSDRSSQRVSSFTGLANLAFAESIVGMNVNEVPNILKAVQDYCDNIMAAINNAENFNPEADSTIAFKSDEVTEALKNYLATVREYLINLTSQLAAFGDKIQDARRQWEAATQEMATNINSTGGSNFASSTRYTMGQVE